MPDPLFTVPPVDDGHVIVRGESGRIVSNYWTEDGYRKRLMSKIEIAADGCWNWTAFRQGGYGIISHHGKLEKAHRLAYELFVGPIPDGLQIDHLCRNRACVNPEHLEPVTSGENSRRSPITLSGANIRKTHCPQGHPYDEANTEWYRGHRYCYACRHKAKS